jgi:hypothetical protein
MTGIKELLMPTIRITEETWERLKGWAVPLEDTPNDAIWKALDAADGIRPAAKQEEAPRSRSKRKAETRSKKLLPQREFRRPLMRVLYELGGGASTKELKPILADRLRPELSEDDLRPVPSGGEVRWWNAVCWERKDLVEEGLLKDNSARGVWELTDRGAEYIEQ